MRAILLLLMVTAGCGNKGGNTFELDIAVYAPQASSALVGATPLPAGGGVYAQGFADLSAAERVHGTVATINADGTVRASAMYQLGNYCAAQMPLVRQTMHFVESLDPNGAIVLPLDSIECEKSDGTGTIVKP